MEFLVYAASSFGLGALHVLEPGHGRMLVLAYLVGSKGRVRDALVLGLVTTFTHTFVVILLGVLSTLATAYFASEKIERVLGLVASAMIIGVGLWMIVTRTREVRESEADHPQHEPDHGHLHHRHHHPAPAAPQAPLTLPGLVALGVSGGLIPCPSALGVLLMGISAGQFVWSLVLVLIFSFGMASVLVGLGLAIVKTADYTHKTFRDARWQRYIPLASAYLITLLGGVLLWRVLVEHAH